MPAPGIVATRTARIAPECYQVDFTLRLRLVLGPVWIEDLADGLGIPLTDYAVGGATANNALIPGLLTLPDGATFTPPSAADQVKAWSEQLHQDEKAEDISDELFVIFIGANDGFNAAAANLKNQGNVGHIAMDGVAHAVVSNIEAIIKTIQVKGGKHFLLATYPDLSKIPLDQEYSPFSPEFVPDLLTYTNSLRSATQDLVRQLQANHVKVTLADIYLLGNDILAHPMTYGFERTDVGCVVGSFPTRTLCSEDPKVQNTYAFW
ncbi:hypothetical protein FRB97_003303 [Tulasnella sp. 331]|nr:hypothetical protein FRB97_003303 [Tulasnella sp. 331]